VEGEKLECRQGQGINTNAILTEISSRNTFKQESNIKLILNPNVNKLKTNIIQNNI